MNWYIVQAYSGFEKKVVETIKDELKKHKLSEKLENLEDLYGVTNQEMLDAGADQSFLDALVADDNTWNEDEAGEEDY